MEMMKYNLQFFGQDGPGGEKTEDATTKKLSDARNDGQVAKSQDLIMALQLVGLFLLLKYAVGFIGNSFIRVFKEIFSILSTLESDLVTYNVISSLINFCIKEILIISLPVFAIAFLIALLGNLIQVKWKVSTKPLMPKFNKINPVSGFKNLISPTKLMELLKSVGKLIVIFYVVFDALKDQWGLLMNMYGFPLYDALVLIGSTVIDLGVKISFFFMAIAFIDVFYQKRKFKKDMKMTKQEIKDEYKNSEGDPQIKGKIRRKMMEASQKRMMQQIPESDVVITNPTHLAVAVKYDRGNSEAPIVVAKGADYLANKIKEIASENKVEIVENKPLARMLYYNVEIGDEIPQELYQMVAEVLAYVYEIKGKL